MPTHVSSLLVLTLLVGGVGCSDSSKKSKNAGAYPRPKRATPPPAVPAYPALPAPSTTSEHSTQSSKHAAETEGPSTTGGAPSEEELKAPPPATEATAPSDTPGGTPPAAAAETSDAPHGEPPADVAAPTEHAHAPPPDHDARPPAAEAVPSEDPPDIGAPKYAVCTGQGANPLQLAPAFLEDMAVCTPEDVATAAPLRERAGEGELIAGKGDCQFGAGISCHYHSSMEFVRSGMRRDKEREVGELHCIVPSADKNSPTVYGAHVRCKRGTSPERGTAVCSSALLDTFTSASCQSDWRCCDNGTLTKPLGRQQGAELSLRPDFRICAADYVEVDCGLFKGMHAHTANVAGLGEAYTGHFNPPMASTDHPPEHIGEPKYPVCAGQGGDAKQLAPAFLDDMAACEAADVAPADSLVQPGADGRLMRASGECRYGSGIRCHYHTSMEFVSKHKLADDERAVGELHCVVQSEEENSPTVYGAHVRCRAGTTPDQGKGACSAELLDVLSPARCQSGWKCCDNGTLTPPLHEQTAEERATRPDFRVCADEYVEVDCGLFRGMRGRPANVAGLGEAVDGEFNARPPGRSSDKNSDKNSDKSSDKTPESHAASPD